MGVFLPKVTQYQNTGKTFMILFERRSATRVPDSKLPRKISELNSPTK